MYDRLDEEAVGYQHEEHKYEEPEQIYRQKPPSRSSIENEEGTFEVPLIQQ
jgi:hypothetical protein